jgi:hypothetical protein
MNRLARRIFRLATTLGIVALIWSCNAPFIPVPPPGMITFTPDTAPDGNGGTKTVWITQGGPNAQAGAALFYVFDDERQAGVITHAAADGSFVSTPMDGTRGDHVHIYFRTPKGEYSPETCRLLIEGPADAPACP